MNYGLNNLILHSSYGNPIARHLPLNMGQKRNGGRTKGTRLAKSSGWPALAHWFQEAGTALTLHRIQPNINTVLNVGKLWEGLGAERNSFRVRRKKPQFIQVSLS